MCLEIYRWTDVIDLIDVAMLFDYRFLLFTCQLIVDKTNLQALERQAKEEIVIDFQ
jgi:hypothetical protein